MIRTLPLTTAATVPKTPCRRKHTLEEPHLRNRPIPGAACEDAPSPNFTARRRRLFARASLPSRYPRPAWTALLALTFGCLALRHTRAAPTPPSLEEYGIIVDRNIFDPDRARPTPPVQPPPPAPVPEPPKAREYLALTGVLLGDEAVIAFVASSRSEWSGAFSLAPGQSIGPGKVLEADTTGITIAIGEGSLQWQVGAQIEKGHEGWHTAEGRAPESPSQETKPTSDSASDKSAASDLLKKLMERRQKESR